MLIQTNIISKRMKNCTDGDINHAKSVTEIMNVDRTSEESHETVKNFKSPLKVIIGNHVR